MARRGKPQSSSEEDRRGVQSIEIGAPLLMTLAASGDPMALKDLSAAVEMAPSKAHRYITSFIRCGLIRQSKATGHYSLGHSALALGLGALSQIDLVGVASDALADLTARTGITSLLSVWGPQGPVIIRWRRSRQLLVTSLNLGSVLPATTSATGHIFLAYLPRDYTADHVAREFAEKKKLQTDPQFTRKQLDQMIASVRASRLAWADSSVIPGLRAIASPVLDVQNEAAAVITLIGTDPYLTNPNHEAATALIETCEACSTAQVSGVRDIAASA